MATSLLTDKRLPMHNPESTATKSAGMANTILTVIVSHGRPPAPILVRCFKDGKHFLDISSPGSFNHHFTDLVDGDYDIYIIGFNDKTSGNTTCYLSEDQIKVIPPDVSPIKSETPAYLVGFHFTVGDED